MPDATSEARVCSKCRQVKPRADFPQGKGYCKPCRTAYERERYRNNAAVRAKRKEARERDRDSLREYQAAHYQKNREKRLAAAAEYAKQNPPDPERRREVQRAWYAKNREAHLARKRVWRAANPPDPEVHRAWCNANREHLRESMRKWYASSETARAMYLRANARRRARLRQLPTDRYTVEQIIERDGTCCVLCSGELDFDARWPELQSVTVEHLECISWPGSAGDVLSNVALAHWGCNNARHNKPHPAAAAKRAVLIGH